MHSANRNQAFTLVELMVVIAITALLIALLMPALSAARESARRQVCATQVRSINLASQLYGNDFKNFLPVGYAVDTPAYWLDQVTTGGASFSGVRRLWDAGRGYMTSTREYMRCPSRFDRVGDYVRTREWNNGFSSYGWAGSIGFSARAVPGIGSWETWVYLVRIDLQKSNRMLLYDGIYPEPTINFHWLQQNNHFPGLFRASNASFVSGPIGIGGNFSYIDGSGKWLNYSASDFYRPGNGDHRWPVGQEVPNRTSSYYFKTPGGDTPYSPTVGTVVK